MGIGLRMLAGALIGFCGCAAPGDVKAEKRLTLAEHGKTRYQIIAPASPLPADRMALDELSGFLKKATGADFKVFSGSPEAAAGLRHRIFVGMSPEAVRILGGDPVGSLRDQEHVVKNIGDDIFLFGRGESGNLSAVYRFLENQIGCRWYTAYGDMMAPRREVLELEEFSYKRGFAFPVRGIMTFFYKLREDCALFCRRNFQNQLLPPVPARPGIKNIYNELQPLVHTSFAYMPPGGPVSPGCERPLPWLRDKEFFITNPDFFSMDENGKRVNNRQLCFGNPELRRKLTEHIEKHLNELGGKGVLELDANDVAGEFCHCKTCVALADKYKTPGGPLFDYLLELCAYLGPKYPDAYVRTLAYRKKQSETPPSGISKLPENLIITFAPIDDNILASMSHPSNSGTLNNLKKWCGMSKHVWIWYYPNPYFYANMPPPPFSDLERLRDDIKLFRNLGAEGMYFEHDSGVGVSANFSELQSWILLKLFDNPDLELAPLVREFTDYYYGPAAPVMREYIAELETLRKETLESGKFWRFDAAIGQYTYLTPANIMRWESMFDSMEEAAAGGEDALFHVRLARMSLDAVSFHFERKLAAARPELKERFPGMEKRLTETYTKMLRRRMPGMSADISEWLAQIRMRPPLPPPFDKIPAETLFQVNPNYPRKLHKSLLTEDKAAAWGAANFERLEKKPFQIGFYDYIAKKSGVTRAIDPSEVTPGVYKFYKLGTVKLTPNCIIWGGTWWIQSQVGHLYSIDDPDAEYEAYVSLKFEGNDYSAAGKNKPYKVLHDQVILVKKDRAISE